VRAIAVRDVVEPKEADIARYQPEPSQHLSTREALAVQLAERIALDPHAVDDEFFEQSS